MFPVRDVDVSPATSRLEHERRCDTLALMKTLKALAVMATAAVLVSLTIGATSTESDRPGNTPEERWVPVGPNAGFVLSAEVAGPPPKTPLPSMRRFPGEVVAAEFYVKTRAGWQRARIDNPAHVTPLRQ